MILVGACAQAIWTSRARPFPTFHAAATLARAAESIRGQTLTDWELIAVDDGSTDGSRDMLAALARTDRRVRLLPQPHRGIVAALNAGLAAGREVWRERLLAGPAGRHAAP